MVIYHHVYRKYKRIYEIKEPAISKFNQIPFKTILFSNDVLISYNDFKTNLFDNIVCLRKLVKVILQFAACLIYCSRNK